MYKLTLLLFAILLSDIPDKRVVAEWEHALGTMIRWPLGIPQSLVVELAADDIIYVLVETSSQQNQATNSFNNLGINSDNIVFIDTDTYSHWTRDHGPQFIIGAEYWKVVNQQFNGYPEEPGCEDECDDSMILFDCSGSEFCNNQPAYASEGYDCYVNNDLCQDFNGDGQIMDWVGDGYCDDGSWGLDFMCDEYSWDCGDCGGSVSDENGYCEDLVFLSNRINDAGRPFPSGLRGWSEDDDTNIDFANQLGWDIQDLPLFWTGGNFMTDGYGAAFSTELMVNENNIEINEFKDIINEHLYIDNYHIFDNPNESSIQHIDCLAKLVSAEKIIIKQVPESSPEYDCIEEFANSFNNLSTFYNRSFEIHRVFCPSINGGPWEWNPVAAYTNSLILNNKVLVPQYGIPEDEQALITYQNVMPGYEVIGFDGALNNPWYSEDALHCRTMGVFNPEMMHVSHQSVRSEEIISSQILIDVEAIDYSGETIEFVSVFWKYSDEDGPFGNFLLEYNEGVFSGVFPALNINSDIDYYISATNSLEYSAFHPIVGWHQFRTLNIMLGDLNLDGIINILDVVLIVNTILNGDYQINADINSDSQIDVLDIVQIINIILN